MTSSHISNNFAELFTGKRGRRERLSVGIAQRIRRAEFPEKEHSAAEILRCAGVPQEDSRISAAEGESILPDLGCERYGTSLCWVKHMNDGY